MDEKRSPQLLAPGQTPAMAVREAYGQALVELGRQSPDVVALEADTGKSSRSCLFAAAFPERYFNVGIAEGNMTAMAAGFAACGKIPFVNVFAVFATLRAGDPLRTLVAYTGLNVKIAGTYAGLSDSYDGATHQSIEDLAVVRALPNMTVLVPADATEARLAVFAAAAHRGPVFIRLSRAAMPVLYAPEHAFRIGKACHLREGTDITLVACGYMVHKALEAAQLLAGRHISAAVLAVHTIKPLDAQAIVSAARTTGRIVTIEEHSIIGGLGGAVAELLAQHHPVPMRLLGIPDVFGESGDYEALLHHFKLDGAGIAAEVERFLRDSRHL